jgi:hypothetical protein
VGRASRRSCKGTVFEEALHIESPIQGFFRETTGEATVDGSSVPAGARVLLHFGAENRDAQSRTSTTNRSFAAWLTLPLHVELNSASR